MAENGNGTDALTEEEAELLDESWSALYRTGRGARKENAVELFMM